jgi:hypothetical protein
MQAIHFALGRTHCQGPGRIIAFDLKECVHPFNLYVLNHLRLYAYLSLRLFFCFQVGWKLLLRMRNINVNLIGRRPESNYLGDNCIVFENFTASMEIRWSKLEFTGDALAEPVNGYLRPLNRQLMP